MKSDGGGGKEKVAANKTGHGLKFRSMGVLQSSLKSLLKKGARNSGP